MASWLSSRSSSSPSSTAARSTTRPRAPGGAPWSGRRAEAPRTGEGWGRAAACDAQIARGAMVAAPMGAPGAKARAWALSQDAVARPAQASSEPHTTGITLRSIGRP
eukprot:CAMPEP_0180126922 /NCGR_PEP_ID=MMETSP0986-20121125/5963_1 /TAXON_ID=697907 /ORGANISM="non described non described, Strain CCMP2293" /LENGTH=106 /DNA_ID=CAMNT_0022066401 /DNA_START=106 /DNA_END=423 /DNA_ORIENTATION=+